MNPFVPMLSITGNPTKRRLETHHAGFLKNGVDRFMIYARTGLEAEYMSEDWHRICKICIDFARRNNMEVWLYDKYNWPSGSCKNAVTNLNNSFIASRFEYKTGVVAVEKMGTNETNMAIDPFCVDVLNPDAVKSFISLTHERYYEWFKEDFGKTIKGFYSDEPSFDYSTSNDNQLPFYDGLIEDYNNACGRDIFADAKDYFEGKKSADFYEVYAKLIGDKFCNFYFKTVGEWCEKHNVVFTGHLVADDSLLGSVKATGAFAVLDRRETEGDIRKLILVNNGENREFELLPLGVYTDLDKTPHYETVSLINEYKLKRSDTDILRPYMSKREIEIEIPKNTEFYLNVRQYPRPSKVYLDGKLLNPENKSDKLTKGLNPLYLKTDKILLKKGSHTIASTDEEKDFLPIIIGEYKMEVGEVFYNKISVDFEIETQSSTEPLAITFDNCKLATELYLEGEFISAKSVTPFVFEIPKAYNGKTLKQDLFSIPLLRRFSVR